MTHSRALLRILLLLLPIVAMSTLLAEDAGWVEIDYSELVDRRQLSHSGEPVGVLLNRLDGRGFPPEGERAADRLMHSLLDPLLEPYAFVLSDALDALLPSHDAPYVEIGGLWIPGEPQPAWVELLRARRYVVESDGRGKLRLCLPVAANEDADGEPADAARRAFLGAWPVMRFVIAAERARLDGSPALEVSVHAYRHLRERSRFRLSTAPLEITVEDSQSNGYRPPLDLDELQAFLDAGLQLEGARLDPVGRLRLLGSRLGRTPSMLGRPITLADLAVAYRAVFHGGLAEPYMSLDRGMSPQTSVVSYGGRLRDTSMGLVSLLCDIRFKTFSLGLDIVRGRDVRDRLRRDLPSFRTHLERLAADPLSQEMTGQQTRLWFYPDRVDLTISRQGDLLAMRRVRMSAESERVSDPSLAAGRGEDPPWTRATVDAINSDYDRLSRSFRELADLDQVVRLLSLFTWLRQAGQEGHLLPDLDTLLAVELPARYTPRVFPQLLTFNALPVPPGAGIVDVFDRVPMAEGLDRLNPADARPLPPRRRLDRAVAALDREDAQNRALLEEIARHDLGTADAMTLDHLAYRAERLRMHQTVLASLAPAQRDRLAARQQSGQKLRVFSVGIGGLDLGMGSAVRRARGSDSDPDRSATGDDESRERARGPMLPLAEWRLEPQPRVATAMPIHGADGSGRTAFGEHWIEWRVALPESAGPGWIRSVQNARGTEVRSRKLVFGEQGRAASFERVENGRFLRYAFQREGASLRARIDTTGAKIDEGSLDSVMLPRGLARMQVVPRAAGAASESPKLGLRLEAPTEGSPRRMEADAPRGLLQRLVVGREADRAAGRPLVGLSPLPGPLAGIDAMMVMQSSAQRANPWIAPKPPVPGEEDAVRIARALGAWWATEPAEDARKPAAVVGTDARRSPGRWSDAPAPSSILLWVPDDGFDGPLAPPRRLLVEAWGAGAVVSELPEKIDADLVLLVADEAPDRFAARLWSAARSPRLSGKLLAAWCLAGPLREDLPAAILDKRVIAGLGLGSVSVVGRRDALERLRALGQAVREGRFARADQLPGPFLWYF